MKRSVISPAVPASSSPVAHATVGAGLVFVGGQMPRERHTGRIAKDPLAQVRLSMEYCMAVLAEVGSGPAKVLFATVYVTDLGIKPIINDVFRETFGDQPPARDLVEVSAIGEGALVEISLIALA